MNELDRFKRDVCANINIISAAAREFDNDFDDFMNWISEIGLEKDEFLPKKGRKRNAIPSISEQDEENEAVLSNNKKICSRENSSNDETVSNSSSGRSTRTASKIALQSISKQVNLHLNSKLRRPEGFSKFEIQIKQEKLSFDPKSAAFGNSKVTEIIPVPPVTKTENKSSLLGQHEVKQEKEAQARPKRTRARTKRTRKNTKTTSRISDSDVELEVVDHPVLTISDSETEENRIDKNNLKEKQIENKKLDVENKKHEKLEGDKKTNKDKSEGSKKNDKNSSHVDLSCKSVYEDAVENHTDELKQGENRLTEEKEVMGKILDQTITISKNNASSPDNTAATTSTEDNSSEILFSAQDSKNKKGESTAIRMGVNSITKAMTTKLIFSPQDPVKKRIEAIEKLQAQTMEEKKTTSSEEETKPAETVRVTRTKTRALKAAIAESKENIPDQEDKCPKYYTPQALQRLAPLTSSVSKTNNIVTTLTSFLPTNNSSSTKTRSESRERREEEARRKLEREDEVQKKKDALILAKVEEQKRKREEKALKVQQIREQKERERQLQIEKQERENVERQRQLAERDQQLKREIQRKKALAEKRAQEIEERRRAEDIARQQRLLEQEELEKRQEMRRKKEQEEADKLHLMRLQEAEQAKAAAQKWAVSKAKQLSKAKKMDSTPTSASAISKTKHFTRTLTIYDFLNEDGSEKKPSPLKPSWASSRTVKQTLFKSQHVPLNVIDTLFGSKPTTINLKEVFNYLPDQRRNSSAVWRTPPRYSQMPKY